MNPWTNPSAFGMSYWRKRPMHLVGGVPSCITKAITLSTIELAVERLEQSHPNSVKRGTNGEVFAQSIQRVDPRLKAIADELSSPLPIHTRPWLDVVFTPSGGGIGCHYDDSDNFVMQIHGMKKWKLCHSSLVPAREREERMAGNPYIGDFYMPDDCIEYDIRPGDLLYIPRMWPHWGISEVDGLSVTLVLNGPPITRRHWPAPSPQTGCLKINMCDVNTHFTNPIPPLSLENAVVPRTDSDPWSSLHAHLGRLLLKRLLVTIRNDYILLGPLQQPAQHLLNALLGLSPNALSQALRRPEISSWVFEAWRCRNFRYANRKQAMIKHLGASLIPILVAHDKPFDPLQVTLTSPCTLRMLPLGCSINLWGEDLETVSVSFDGDLLQVDGVPFSKHELTMNSTNPAIHPLSRVLDGPPIWLYDSWLSEVFPKDPLKRAGPLWSDISSDELEWFVHQVSEGWSVINKFWPELMPWLNSSVLAISPLPSNGIHPHNASVHAFRGLVTTSGRRSYLMAQTLAHESGHNRFSTITDLFDLYEYSSKDVVFSPFLNTERPMLAVWHGMMAFTQDLYLSRRMLGKIDPEGGPSISSYIHKIRSRLENALSIVRTSAVLTPRGEELIRGIEAAMPDE